MDYKYIEQLLDSYWRCETSPEEEKVLRAFFSQSNVPSHLERYRSLFVYEDQVSRLHLGDDFDRRLLEAIGEKEETAKQHTVRARRIPWNVNLRPFYRAVAVLAIVLTLGNAAQHQFGQSESEAPDYNYADYKDTYTDPQVAFDEVSSALQEASSGLQTGSKADSAKLEKEETGEP